ncbi:MAG TPA: superoxide dismutase [Alphaproteobacteria bacterium]|nr:superoxide dismutase [Alphaproteobacteria bacterium]USO05972.1 MAG: superoxide dismutase [Rhodospirillales bacterium]HOO81173.1 superoxide dismutase [Alphaproteobacteria bacterium]
MSAFDLPELPYAYDALDPYMSAETLEFHHDKHHNAYIVNGNKILEGLDHMGNTLEEVVINAHKQGEQGLFNNAGQHWNHTHFWNWMKPNGGGARPSNLEAAITDSFGSFEAFREQFLNAGATQFGSGWCWLVMNAEGKLEVTKTANADNPLTSGQTALLGCDVWEHSYYIDYRNARPKYLEAFVDNLVNWEYVAELFENASR